MPTCHGSKHWKEENKAGNPTNAWLPIRMFSDAELSTAPKIII
jgi:hypothetical protein